MNIWRKISDIGIHANQPFEEVRRIRLSNQLAFITSIITFLYFLIDLLFFEPREVDQIRNAFYVHHILLSLIMFPVFWLNSLQQYSASRIILILTVSSLNLYTGIIQAQPYRTEFYFMGLAASLFVLFTNTRIIFTVFLFIMFLFCIYVYNVHTAFPDFFALDTGLIIRITIAFTFLFAVLYLLLKESKGNQKTMELKAHMLEQERNEVMRANFTKDRVLSVISHDLRGPLNSLKGLLTLISKGQLSQVEFQNHTQKLNKQVGQLQVSLEELLNWSRSQSTHLKPQPELLEVDQLITFSVNGIKALAEEKGIAIHVSEAHLKIYADQGMIRSVLTNLLTNSIKFTPPHGNIRVTSKQVDQDTTAITVHDTGVGISAENIKNIFDGNYSTIGTNNEKGTGIGLSLCRDFVSKNKGTISVESYVNKGTAFTFSLPNKSANPIV